VVGEDAFPEATRRAWSVRVRVRVRVRVQVQVQVWSRCCSEVFRVAFTEGWRGAPMRQAPVPRYHCGGTGGGGGRVPGVETESVEGSVRVRVRV